MDLVSGKTRVCQTRIPGSGVLTNGAAVTAFEITTDIDGKTLPKGMKIKRIAKAHVDTNDAAVDSISELILYSKYAKAAKDKVYEDTWSDFTEADDFLPDGTEIPYINQDGVGSLYGTVRIKSGATDAAVYLTITFEA